MIAGPNGAGKSTISKELLNPFTIQSFDFDQVFYAKWSRFSFDPMLEDAIRDQTLAEFESEFQQAMKSRQHFSFETNFHLDISARIKAAKANGFVTKLVFIGLKSVSMAIARVNQRVNQGGHFVDNKTIHFRYNEGLINLDNCFDNYDKFPPSASLELWLGAGEDSE